MNPQRNKYYFFKYFLFMSHTMLLLYVFAFKSLIIHPTTVLFLYFSLKLNFPFYVYFILNRFNIFNIFDIYTITNILDTTHTIYNYFQ